MNKLFLHIGTEKTGTTSIQNLLSSQNKLLNKHKIHYIENFGLPNSRKLATLTRSINQKDESFINYKITNEKEFILFKNETLKLVKFEIEKKIKRA